MHVTIRCRLSRGLLGLTLLGNLAGIMRVLPDVTAPGMGAKSPDSLTGYPRGNLQSTSLGHPRGNL